MLEATTAIGEVLVCFTVKLYSRKIFSYVFCVRNTFTTKKSELQYFKISSTKLQSPKIYTQTQFVVIWYWYIHLVSTTTKNK